LTCGAKSKFVRTHGDGREHPSSIERDYEPNAFISTHARSGRDCHGNRDGRASGARISSSDRSGATHPLAERRHLQDSLWEMDAHMGGKWRFEASHPSGTIVVNGISDFKAHGEITEFNPPRVLAYTWLGTGTTTPSGRQRRAGNSRPPKLAPGSESLTVASPTNRLHARITRAAGRDCSTCLENIANENKGRGDSAWLPVQ
jgi:hypothetical protein